MYHWPGPRSLAATNGVSFDVLSSGYLDVSVPRVRFKPLWIQDLIPSLTSRSVTPAPDRGHPQTGANLTIRQVEGGFPHSEIPGSKLVRSSPRLIAAYHALHRLSAPRHPPNARTALDRSHDPCPPMTESFAACHRARGHKKSSDRPLSGSITVACRT